MANLTSRINELQIEISIAIQNGNDDEALSLRGLQAALIYERVELQKLLGQQKQQGKFPFQPF